MHTVDLLDAAIRYAQGLGIRVREDWLDGTSGGVCEIANESWLFLDLSQSPQERLDAVFEALCEHPSVLHADYADVPPAIEAMLQPRAA